MSFFKDYLCLNDIIINPSAITFVELFEDGLMIYLNNSNSLLLDPEDAKTFLVRLKDYDVNLTEEFLAFFKKEKEDLRSFLEKMLKK